MDFVCKNIEQSEVRNFVNTKNKEGWAAAHFSSFVGNFDSLNYLIENGATLLDKNDQEMSSVDEMIRNDHRDLLSCIYERVKNVERDQTVANSFGHIHLAAGTKNSRCLKYLVEDE